MCKILLSLLLCAALSTLCACSRKAFIGPGGDHEDAGIIEVPFGLTKRVENNEFIFITEINGQPVGQVYEVAVAPGEHTLKVLVGVKRDVSVNTLEVTAFFQTVPTVAKIKVPARQRVYLTSEVYWEYKSTTPKVRVYAYGAEPIK